MPLFEIGDDQLIPFRRVPAGPELYEEEIERNLSHQGYKVPIRTTGIKTKSKLRYNWTFGLHGAGCTKCQSPPSCDYVYLYKAMHSSTLVTSSTPLSTAMFETLLQPITIQDLRIFVLPFSRSFSANVSPNKWMK